MKSMIRCPSCGRRRKPGHESRIGHEFKIVKGKNDKETRTGIQAYSLKTKDKEGNVTSWECVPMAEVKKLRERMEAERVAVIAKADAKMAEVIAKGLLEAVKKADAEAETAKEVTEAEKDSGVSITEFDPDTDNCN